MTTDLKIYKGRVSSVLMPISLNGLDWAVKTFTKIVNNNIIINNEDVEDVIKKARDEGLEVDD